MKAAAEALEALGVAYEAKVVSAHRTPQRLYDYATTAKAHSSTAPTANPQDTNSESANANKTAQTPEGPNPAYRAAVVDLCRAILNLNEFVYID